MTYPNIKTKDIIRQYRLITQISKTPTPGSLADTLLGIEFHISILAELQRQLTSIGGVTPE